MATHVTLNNGKQMRAFYKSPYLHARFISISCDTPPPDIRLSRAPLPAIVGLGTWKSAAGLVRAAVISALESGIRHIDCAAAYGNEGEVGEGLADCFARGVCKREDVFVTSKLWVAAAFPEEVAGALAKTLADLKLTYLDLCASAARAGNLFRDARTNAHHRHPDRPRALAVPHLEGLGLPGARREPPRLRRGRLRASARALRAPRAPALSLTRHPTHHPTQAAVWAEMEKAVDAGLTRAIGCSNMTAKKLAALLTTARIVPAVNQVESHPFLSQSKELAWLTAKGIVLTAYSPLGSPDRPARLIEDADPTPLHDAVVGAIAAKHGVDAARVLIRWQVQRGVVVIPKSTTPARIASNADVFGFKLDEEDLAAIAKLDVGARLIKGHPWLREGETWQALWDTDYAY